MNMRRLFAHGVLACASSLLAVACSIGLMTASPVEATSTIPAAAAGHAPAAAASPSIRGTEHFQMMTTSATARTVPVIAWGAFTAAGIAREGKDGVVRTIAFPGGTIKLTFSGTASGGGSVSSTCLATEFFDSAYSLSGTGKYRHISGREHYAANATEIQARVNGSCSQNRRPLAFQQVITASGPVKLP